MSENMEYMGAIAKAIFNSQEMQRLDWTQASIVFEVDDDGYLTGTYGYAYGTSGKPNAVAPDIDDVEAPVLAYREWLLQEGDKGFIKLLFQFDRVNSKVNADFEYENPARWSVTPANIDRIMDELAPKFGD
ncbi:hypothetical protein ABUK73_02175 [Agrobacterium sp. BA1120]|uniref:hypothetical protein n=1 Tax=Agrobacterium sp. BA1120 TaxID=3228927 RepID=UPI00336A4D97